MSEWKRPRFWLSLAAVVLGAVAATWSDEKFGQFAGAIVSGLGVLGVIGLGGKAAINARRARTTKPKSFIVLLLLLALPAIGQDQDAAPAEPLRGPVVKLWRPAEPGVRAAEVEIASMSVRPLGLPAGESWDARGDAWSVPGGRMVHFYRGWPAPSLCVHAGGSGTAAVASIPTGAGMWPMDQSRWIDGTGLVLLDGWASTGGWQGYVTVWDGSSAAATTFPTGDLVPMDAERLPDGRLALLDVVFPPPTDPDRTCLGVLDPRTGAFSRVPGPSLQWPYALSMRGEQLWVSASSWKPPGGERSWRRKLHAFDGRALSWLGTRDVIPDPGECPDIPMLGFGRRPGDPALYARDVATAYRFDAAGRITGSFGVVPEGCGFWGPFQMVYDRETDVFVAQINVATDWGPWRLWLIDPGMLGVHELEPMPDAVGRIAGRP